MCKNAVFIVLLAIFLLFYFLASHAPMFADDYSFFFDNHTNLLQTIWEKYFTWGGRLLGHAWMISVQHISPQLFGFIAAGAVCLLLTGIHLLTYGREWKANTTLWQCLFPFAIFWFCLPEAWEVLLWRTGTIYLLAASCACFFLVPYRFYMDSGRWLPQWLALPFVLFAFSIPFWVEVVILPTLFLGAFMLYRRRSRNVTPAWAMAALAALALGTVFSIGAPGNFARANSANAFQLATFISNAITLTYKYFYTIFPSLLVSGFFFVIFWKKPNPAQAFPTALVLAFLASSVFSAVIIFGGGSASYRALSMAFVLALVAANISFGAALARWSALKALPALCIPLLLFATLQTCSDYQHLLTAQGARTAHVKAALQRNEDTVYVQEYPAVRQKNYFFLDTLRGNPVPWPVQFSKWFGLKNAYLLMDAAPATLKDAASQAWAGNVTIGQGLALQGVYVTPRDNGKVVSAIFQGATSTIEEIFFLTVAQDSSLIPSIAKHLLPAQQYPARLTTTVEKIASELFDRTRIEIGPNTTMDQGNNTALFYAKLHPRGGTTGNIALVIRIKAHGEAFYIRCF